MHSEILGPVIALVAWSLVVLLWLYVRRIPAMRKAGIDVAGMTGSKPGGLDGVLAERSQWPAHNYMHLMEQPTLFYAIALTLALLGSGNGFNATLAWVYVGLRILHSLVQITVNRVIVRFVIFALSTLPLIMLTVHAAMAFNGWSFHH